MTRLMKVRERKKRIIAMFIIYMDMLNNFMLLAIMLCYLALRALDGTYIKVNVPEADKSRYRTRKGEIATNVLGVCSPDLQFIYVLPGWEGSAADSRVLRDAISRPNGLKVPQGYYYLCDAGYMNGEGFLTPYRGQRYHLSEWRNGLQPSTPKEFFNMKHSSARNVIERCFGLLKGRWAILREKSFYPVKTQGRIITACCLLHNHIRNEMALDPLERNLGALDDVSDEVMSGDMITTVEPSTAWSQWRDNFALDIFNSVKSTKRQWTAEEDAVLVQGLLKLVDDGWKADAGSFKPGYTKVLEKYIHNKFPGCTLRANPHIESRVKRLKSQYSAIKDMLGPSASGFGWDDTRKMIMVEKEIYSQWCKSHPTAIGLYGKPFPHFDTLDTVFGKDKASGNAAEDTVDMPAAMEKEYFPSTQGGGSEINLNDDEDYFESQIPETPIPNTATPGSNPTNQSQREFYASGVENMKQLSSCFMHEKVTAERRNQIVSILNEIELPAEDVVMAAVLITKDNNLCDCFFAMPTPELRKKFVGMLLRSNGFQ
ncbi:hypothetical protein TSUD_302360 [Trifolium subterraneum]|uniref:Myb/SANT-like domain-containing protein n=1 Tax=Trifolium subterraneum TaxID=3900 RepID=A0A2Z6NNS9_TRISU|nr:hypothetical protein TSUD_302360 [Trifolium subterraneum]